jgi:hypothetical protein
MNKPTVAVAARVKADISATGHLPTAGSTDDKAYAAKARTDFDRIDTNGAEVLSYEESIASRNLTGCARLVVAQR